MHHCVPGLWVLGLPHGIILVSLFRCARLTIGGMRKPAADLTATPRTDPTEIYRYRDCLYADDMLIAALVHLDLFSWLARRGSATLAAICEALGLVERPADVMLTLFKARGLLVEENGAFHLSAEAAEYLVADSPWFLGPYYGSLKDRRGALDLLDVLRTGKPVLWGGKHHAQEDWHTAMADDCYAARFTAAMDCRGVYLAQAAAKKLDLSTTTRLLDIAGGSGIYACSFVAHHPHLRVAVFEKPPVDDLARKLILQRGFEERVDVIAGDMFTPPLPADFDAHLWSNVLHDWDVPEVKTLLAESAAALRSGGLLIIHDAWLNPTKDGPLHVAEYSVTLAHGTQGRCYSIKEMTLWLHAAGFEEVRHFDTVAARGVLTARRR
ncbi:MAG: methyltransferase [Verrucomicrobiales bacterium]